MNDRLAIAACSGCNGSGVDAESFHQGPSQAEQCDRCAAMPWLPCSMLHLCPETHRSDLKCQWGGKFKPDPDSIEWRCELLQLYWPASDDTPGNRRGLPYNCETEPFLHDDCGWVARPTRIAVLERVVPNE